MILEGVVLKDAREMGNKAQLGVYIPALMPTVLVPQGAQEMQKSIDKTKFVTTDKSADIASSISGRNYVVVSIMHLHNQMEVPIQEGEHVFVGFIDNDVKRPFVYPWGGPSNVKHRMRDKIKLYVSNKKSVPGDFTAEHMHFIEIDSEAMTMDIKLVNSEGEAIAWEQHVDYGAGLWHIKDSADNRLVVQADPDSPDNNNITLGNPAGTKIEMFGKIMNIIAPDDVNIKTTRMKVDASESYTLNTSEHAMNSDNCTNTVGQALTETATTIAQTASDAYTADGMSVAINAKTTLDAMAKATATIGVSGATIMLAPGMGTYSPPVNAFGGIVSCPCIIIGGAPPPPGTLPPVVSQGTPGPKGITDLAGGTGVPLAKGQEILDTVAAALGACSVVGQASWVPAGGVGVLNGAKAVVLSEQAKG
jgi:hypothetical protein